VSRAPDRAARLASLALCALLSACITAPPKPAPIAAAPWPQNRARLQQLAQFELKGRVGVAAGNDGFSAALDWQQRGERSSLALDGPLGIGGVRIVRDGAQLTVRNSHGQQLDSDAARAELVSKLGFEPPLSSLRYWVVGVPDPALPADETVGSDQRLAALDQDGWHIVYGGYMAAAGDWLPQKVTLDRAGVRVRLFIESWQA